MKDNVRQLMAEDETVGLKVKRHDALQRDHPIAFGSVYQASLLPRIYLKRRELQLNNANLYNRIAQLEASMSQTQWPFPHLQQMERSPEPVAPIWEYNRTESLPSTESKGSGSSPLDQASPYDSELPVGMHGIEFRNDLRW